MRRLPAYVGDSTLYTTVAEVRQGTPGYGVHLTQHSGRSVQGWLESKPHVPASQPGRPLTVTGEGWGRGGFVIPCGGGRNRRG